jgi:YVTN family beta-propeller protein
MDRGTGLIYVANSWDDTVSEVADSMRVNRTLSAGREPTGLACNAREHLLYVANRISGDVSVIDLKTGRTGASLPVGPGASYLAAAPGGDRVFVTRIFPSVPGNRGRPQNEIVEIDAGALETRRYPMPGSGAAFHVTFSARGEFGIAAILRPKNLIPTARVENGGIFGNSLALFGSGLAQVVTLPLDEIENSLAQPFDVAVAPDLSKVFVSASGADEVAILDGRLLLALAKAPRSERLPMICPPRHASWSPASPLGATRVGWPCQAMANAYTSQTGWMTPYRAWTRREAPWWTPLFWAKRSG